MRPSYPLDDDLARQSSLYGKVVFVVATPGTGAETLVRAMGEFGGFAAIPVETALFSQGMFRLLDQWQHDPSDQGFHYLCSAQEFLLAARNLADAPLEAALDALGGDLLVEYSVDHIKHHDDIRCLYPDARIVHVVRDGRLVADRLADSTDGWAARFAARRWVDDQREAWEKDTDGTVKFEAVMADPAGSLTALAEALDVEADDTALAAAVSHFRGSKRLLEEQSKGRAGAIVEIVAPEVLNHFGYELNGSTRSARAAAWSEIAMYGALTGALELRRRAQHKLATRYGQGAWLPMGKPPGAEKK
jgi:hypothetical protein